MKDNIIIERLNQCINRLHGEEIRIMEVCGTHTVSISKSGIRSLLPKEVQLLSGPGCPVCVTPKTYIDIAIELLNVKDVILVTFGDMLKVKGSKLSLSDGFALGSKIIIIYSPEDALNIAAKNKDKLIVFIAVGFETTAPLIGSTVKLANERSLENLFFITALKLMDPVIRFILQNKSNKINAMICPGHVASIKGSEYFRFITDEFGIPAVICGFENQDVAAAICLLLEQLTGKRNVEFLNIYKRCVSSAGNIKAQKIIKEVFDIADGVWRGIGTIRKSALVLNDKYKHMDAVKRFGITTEQYFDDRCCLCGEILMGQKLPNQCDYFGSVCTPEHPAGPCMVSSEGACATHFRFRMSEKYG